MTDIFLEYRISVHYSLSFFLVGWGTDQLSGFGEDRGTKHQVINLIHSIRTVMRSKIDIKASFPLYVHSVVVAQIRSLFIDPFLWGPTILGTQIMTWSM